MDDQKPINLLYLMTDQQRFDALSLAGNTVLNTPNIDRLANEGVCFDNAYTCCPVCVPARMAMLTGTSIYTNGVRTNADARDENITPDSLIHSVKTYDEVLIENGYRGEYYGKWHSPAVRALAYANRAIGTAGQGSHPELGLGLAGIYRSYLDEQVSERPAREGELIDRGSGRCYRPDPIDERYGASDPAQKYNSQAGMYGCIDIPREHTRNAFDANRTIDALQRMVDEPFTLHCSFGPPHPPMVSTEYYHSQFDGKEMPLPRSFNDPMEDSPYRGKWEGLGHYRNRDTIGYMIANYYAMVKEIDDQVGRVLDKLDELGLTDRTLVVFTSDHGEMLGSHGMNGKFVFYEESVHIPLVMRLPGAIPAGTVVAEPVSQRDFFATFLDYLNVPDPGSEGHSLRGLIEGSGWGGDDFVVAEWPHLNVPGFMVRTQRWKLMFGCEADASSVDALYDLEYDPLEISNVIGQQPEQALSLKDRLVSWLERVNSPYLDGVKARALPL